MKKLLLSLIVIAGVYFYFGRSCNQHNDTDATIAESESDEVDWLDETEARNAEFVERIKSDPSLLDNETDGLLKSDDGNLTIYYWDDGTGGSMISWANIVKYKYKGKENLKYFVEAMCDLTPKSELSSIGGDVTGVHLLKTKSGRVVYIVSGFCRYSGSYASEWINLFEIKDGDLLEINTSKDVDDLGLYIDIDISDWYGYRYGIRENWSGYFKFDKRTQTLYVPEVEDRIMTGRYIKHHFNGEEMIPENITCSYGLHSSIKDFKFLVCVFDTQGFRVRVDRMPNGDYRYSSWKSGVSMSTKPDLLIYGGHDYIVDDCFVFDNNGYVYTVEPLKSLKVTHNDKVILDQNKID